MTDTVEMFLDELRAFLESTPLSLPKGETLEIEITMDEEGVSKISAYGKRIAAGPFKTKEEAEAALRNLED